MRRGHKKKQKRRGLERERVKQHLKINQVKSWKKEVIKTE